VTALQIVTAPPVVCWPWHLAGCDPELGPAHPIGANCGECGREIALRRDRPNANALCLYCGMDAGLVPLEEVPPV
jgi:hypothetical protein